MGSVSIPHIILIGSMGAGKSTIGRRLAARLHIPCVDLDAVIVEKAGKSIPCIFDADGEDAFRELESQCLNDAWTDVTPKIIATGGGIVLAASNRKLLQQSGFVIWLDANPDVLARRIGGDANRPLLNGVDPLQRARELDVERRPLYKSCADLCIDTAKLRVPQAIHVIMQAIDEQYG